jgi:hypothetical protein
MRKIVNIIQKSNHIKNRFINLIKGNRHKLKDKPKRREDDDDDDDDDELDDHNDSSNWTYH